MFQGSGKTLAFGIPIIHSILKSRDEEDNNEDEISLEDDDNVQLDDELSREDEENQLDDDNEVSLSDDGIGCVKVVDLPWNADGLNQVTTNSSIKALVLTPTRELAIQVKNHLVDVTSKTDIKVSSYLLSLKPRSKKIGTCGI